jgi:hypothetical protein
MYFVIWQTGGYSLSLASWLMSRPMEGDTQNTLMRTAEKITLPAHAGSDDEMPAMIEIIVCVCPGQAYSRHDDADGQARRDLRPIQ